MTVVHISTYDRHGGACIAAYRQHEALRLAGFASRMWVRFKQEPDANVSEFVPSMSLPSRLRRIARRNYLNWVRARYGADGLFSDDRSEHGGCEWERLPSHDVVNVHWTVGFVDQPASFRMLPSSTPMVYTMHDMNAFTGGCHYSGECLRFGAQCGCCPRLNRASDSDLSRSVWHRKQASYASRYSKRLCFVADSHWLAEQARASALLKDFRVEVIHYGLDLAVFKPLDSRLARLALGIPYERGVVAFAAADVTDSRKGIQYLAEALKGMSEKPFLLSWGRGYPSVLQEFPHLHLGEISSERLMALAYNCADICVVPSLEEAFGQTALEAIACGRPVAAFAAGGLVDTVRHGQTGLLAHNRDARDLRQVIERLLSDEPLRRELGSRGRRLAEEEFSYARNAAQYSALYDELLRTTQ